MLPYFEWKVPTDIIFGNGNIKHLPVTIKNIGKKCLLVTGMKSAEKYGYLQCVIKQLTEFKIKHIHYNKISPNPKTNEIDDAAEIVRKEKIDFIIALGGGSSMDAAKGIAMLAKNDGKIWDYVYKGPGKKYKRFHSALPIVMIPTFAATGSEVNCGAVVSNPETKEKTPFFGDALYPALTIIDPETTHTVPYDSTIDGAIDIICHVLEMYLSTDKDDYLQDQLSLAITKTVVHCTNILKNDLKNSEARAQIFWASSLALSGITTEGRHGTFPMHAIEHALSGLNTSLSHGRGLATIFLKILEYDKDKISKKISDLSAYVFDTKINNTDQAISLWHTWCAAHHTGGSLSNFIKKEDIPNIVSHIIQFSGTPDFLPNIKPFYKKDLEHFMSLLLK